MQRFEGEVVDKRIESASLNMQVFEYPNFFQVQFTSNEPALQQWRISAQVFHKSRQEQAFVVPGAGKITHKKPGQNSPKGEIWNFSYTISAHAITVQTLCKLNLPFCNTLLPFFGLLFLAFPSSFLEHLLSFSLGKMCFLSQINNSMQICPQIHLHQTELSGGNVQ